MCKKRRNDTMVMESYEYPRKERPTRVRRTEAQKIKLSERRQLLIVAVLITIIVGVFAASMTNIANKQDITKEVCSTYSMAPKHFYKDFGVYCLDPQTGQIYELQEQDDGTYILPNRNTNNTQ